LARIIHIRFIDGVFGRETTKYAAICGVYIYIWPTLDAQHIKTRHTAHRDCQRGRE